MCRALFVALLIPSAAACGAFKSVPPPPQEIIVRVNGDPGQPLKDAALLYAGQKVSATGEDGVGKLKLTGKDGESFDITVSCPEGYQSPPKPIAVILRRLADPTKVPEYEVSCPPTARTVVVAVRADGGANLPVMYLGRELSRTDSAGSTHVLLKLKPDETFNLVLGTGDKGNDRLRPQNPSASFTVKDHDDMFTFDQKFEQEKKKAVVVGKRRGPIKIGP